MARRTFWCCFVSIGFLTCQVFAAEEEISVPPSNPSVALLLRLQGTDLAANANLREVGDRPFAGGGSLAGNQ